MRIIRLQAEGYKRLEAVDITPDGDLVEVRGNNGNGKSSVLDAIFVALAGAAVAPIKPVREGEEMAIIRVDLGEIVVTRIFTDDGATRLKVTNADGSATYSSGQTMLDDLIGHIAFDPLEFARLKPEEQAEQLRKLVKIEVDLDQLAKVRKENFDNRRDVNRDVKALKARLDSIPKVDKPETLPDRAALVAALGDAANKNSAIERERMRRESAQREFAETRRQNDLLAARIAEMQAELDESIRNLAVREAEELDLEPLGELVSTDELREKIAQADKIREIVDQIRMRDDLEAEYNQLTEKSSQLTAAIERADKQRNEAIAAAKMPVEGLSLVVGEDEKLGVTFNGIPFSQASSAEQLRVSTAVAMAANPKLRVIRIKDGSLLDKNSLSILREMATENDFQIWGEFVGDEGAGIIMEAGKVRGAPTPEPLDRPRRRKQAAEPVSETASYSVTDGENVAEVDEAGNVTAKGTDETFPKTALPSLFERMGELAKQGADAPTEPPRRPRALTEFRTAPRPANKEEPKP